MMTKLSHPESKSVYLIELTADARTVLLKLLENCGLNMTIEPLWYQAENTARETCSYYVISVTE